jgi:hypothetical protein
MADMMWSAACLLGQAAVAIAGLQHVTNGAFLRSCEELGADAIASAALLSVAVEHVTRNVPSDVAALGVVVVAAGAALRLYWKR